MTASLWTLALAEPRCELLAPRVEATRAAFKRAIE